MPKCHQEGCSVKNAIFDIPSGKGGMIDVEHKTCAFEGCNKRPSYNILGGKSIYCTIHKLEGMIDVVSNRCSFNGCDLIPSFNYLGEKKGIYCKNHKLVGMIDVKSNQCAFEKCDTRPCYNFLGGKAIYCKNHKLVGMIDVKNKHCVFKCCISQPRYGISGNSPSHCAKHRKPGMIRYPRSKCKHLSCNNIAIFGKNYIPQHCEEHHAEDEQNYVERECSSCNLVMVLNQNNQCEYCVPETFQTARLAKQNALMAYLDYRGLNGMSTDTIIDEGECGKERPDRVFDFGNKIIVLECDEHQHRDRACVCEQTRMVNISQSFGGVPVYFIRWNPDDYSPLNPRKIPEAIEKRHKLVADYIRDIQQNLIELPAAFLSVIYMYFDDWDGLANQPWEVITNL
jgi:hypothetical protein